MTASPTAGQPLTVLINSLERAGWGDLAGHDLRGVRGVLAALCRMLPPESATGHVTVEQVAARAGYSTRWARTRMHWLEDLGVITWVRGGIVDGAPEPSRIRIDKRILASLVVGARELREHALIMLTAATYARIAGLRALDVRSRRHKRRSVHVEPTSALPPYGEVRPAPDFGPVPVSTPSDMPETYRTGLMAARSALRQARTRLQAHKT